jgi:hypothetical protein
MGVIAVKYDSHNNQYQIIPRLKERLCASGVVDKAGIELLPYNISHASIF